jgi:hypothetical protein
MAEFPSAVARSNESFVQAVGLLSEPQCDPRRAEFLLGAQRHTSAALIDDF